MLCSRPWKHPSRKNEGAPPPSSSRGNCTFCKTFCTFHDWHQTGLPSWMSGATFFDTAIFRYLLLQEQHFFEQSLSGLEVWSGYQALLDKRTWGGRWAQEKARVPWETWPPQCVSCAYHLFCFKSRVICVLQNVYEPERSQVIRLCINTHCCLLRCSWNRFVTLGTDMTCSGKCQPLAKYATLLMA